MNKFTASEKQAAILRELKMRRGVYPHWIRIGKISPHEAQHQIAIMEEIAEDYDQLAHDNGERLL